MMKTTTATETNATQESVMNKMNVTKIWPVNVTPNEAMVLDCLAMNCYGDQNYGRPHEDKFENYGATWSHSILETGSKFATVVKPKSLPGIIASLSKKGLVSTSPDSGHGERDASVGLTQLGFDVWLELYPNPTPTIADVFATADAQGFSKACEAQTSATPIADAIDAMSDLEVLAGINGDASVRKMLARVAKAPKADLYASRKLDQFAKKAPKAKVVAAVGTVGKWKYAVYVDGAVVGTVHADTWLDANESANTMFSGVTAVRKA